jgi:hypothetical protein
MNTLRVARALVLCLFMYPASVAAWAKDGCTQSWPKGNFKTSREIREELEPQLVDAKILRLSLCSSDSTHYFMVTILESTGKVKVIRVPAH